VTLPPHSKKHLSFRLHIYGVNRGKIVSHSIPLSGFPVSFSLGGPEPTTSAVAFCEKAGRSQVGSSVFLFRSLQREGPARETSWGSVRVRSLTAASLRLWECPCE
jgi:hypothetical protein